MPGAVAMSERKKRNQMLRILSDKKRQQFYRGETGGILTAIFEHTTDERNNMVGFTENYVRVRMPCHPELVGVPLKVTLERFDGSSAVDAAFAEEQAFAIHI
jgi:threonylcarbamoyladenosine tRNA methylthiotransferase MtaB